MLFQLRNLSEKEKESVINAPIYVGLLIGGADGDLSKTELNKLADLIHIKTFSEKNDVQHIYEALEEKAGYSLNALIQKAIGKLPKDLKERETVLIEYIEKLNAIYPKLNSTYAIQLHKSLHNIAVSIANSDGGFFGFGGISIPEKKYIKLPMLKDPSGE